MKFVDLETDVIACAAFNGHKLVKQSDRVISLGTKRRAIFTCSHCGAMSVLTVDFLEKSSFAEGTALDVLCEKEGKVVCLPNLPQKFASAG